MRGSQLAFRAEEPPAEVEEDRDTTAIVFADGRSVLAPPSGGEAVLFSGSHPAVSVPNIPTEGR